MLIATSRNKWKYAQMWYVVVVADSSIDDDLQLFSLVTQQQDQCHPDNYLHDRETTILQKDETRRSVDLLSSYMSCIVSVVV